MNATNAPDVALEVEEEKIQWIKKGGGTFQLLMKNGNRKPIKENQKFWAFPSEVPEAFRDVLIPVDSLPTALTNLDRVISPKSTKFKKVPTDPKDMNEEQRQALADLDVTSPGDATEATDANEQDGADGTDEGADDATGAAGEATATDVADDTGADTDGKDPEYKIEKRSAGWFDVVNIETGKPINESALREAAADELLESLND
jgi:hypothetical protein